MQYVTSIEQMAIEQGIEQGVEQGAVQNLQQCLLEVLEVRFGALDAASIEAIQSLRDIAVLRSHHRLAISVESLSAFQQQLEGAIAASTEDVGDRS